MSQSVATSESWNVVAKAAIASRKYDVEREKKYSALKAASKSAPNSESMVEMDHAEQVGIAPEQLKQACRRTAHSGGSGGAAGTHGLWARQAGLARTSSAQHAACVRWCCWDTLCLLKRSRTVWHPTRTLGGRCPVQSLLTLD